MSRLVTYADAASNLADQAQCSLLDATIELPEYTAADECSTWRLHDTEWGVGTPNGPLFCSCMLSDDTTLAVYVNAEQSVSADAYSQGTPLLLKYADDESSLVRSDPPAKAETIRLT